MLALLALIGLKKFRSFQKPNTIATTFDAFDGRRDGEENKASRGRPRSGGGGQLQSRFGGPEAKYFLDIAYGSE